MKKTLLLICVCLIASASFAFKIGDDELSIKNKAKAELAKQKMYGGQYKAALAMFNEILLESGSNAPVLYYSADCNYRLGEIDRAQELLEKAKATSKATVETFLLLGKIYQTTGKTDKALEEYNAFKTKVTPKELKDSDVDVYVSQCNNAKAMMAAPVNVKVENLGQTVNSKQDDRGPSITADGKKIFFNSRRPQETDSPVDVEGDGKFFENVYFTTWDSVKNAWTEADEVPGQINQPGTHSACKGISPDGKQIFIYKNDLKSPEARGGDIFVSKVMNNKWKTPTPFGKPISTTYWEGGACISPDGKTLFFLSECPKFGKEKGYGGSDIWMIQKISKTEWGKPVNLGSEINTQYQEVGIFLAPDGKTLFFCSNGPNSMGDYDVFRTINEGGKWSKPENLGYPINTIKSDGPLSLSANTQYAYFSSDRPGGFGENDIYRIDLQDYAILEKDYKKHAANTLSILTGMVREGASGTALDGVELSFYGENGEKVSSITTSETGEYLITLKGGVTYNVKITKSGYKESDEKVVLPLNKSGEAYKLEKQFTLNK
jgi:Tol biopolymer transport system component